MYSNNIIHILYRHSAYSTQDFELFLECESREKVVGGTVILREDELVSCGAVISFMSACT